MKAHALMSIKELADFLGVSTDTIRRAARSGLIPFTREGTAYRFHWQQVCQALEARTEEVRTRRSIHAGAPGGRGRPRASQNAPEQVTRGLG